MFQNPAEKKCFVVQKEGFTDAVKTNAALVRKRIRDTRLKVKQKNTGREKSDFGAASIYGGFSSAGAFVRH